MLSRIRKAMDEKDEGFTLIELLVVIIIIGILAAIAIPVFLNQRKKAVDASMKSDLRTVANEIETYYVDNQAYPTGGITGTAGAITIAGNPVKLSSGNTLVYIPPGGAGAATGTYCITASNPNSSVATGVAFSYDSDQGGLQAKSVPCS